VPVGYCISRDQYFKRDDVGIIYQLNVLPTHQRGLIGAHLLKAVFDRAAYGCRLYCCWCAQDIAANRFWEAMGFVPIAFRAGSEKRSRVHIFWEKRIRAGDETTPWWFPCKTDSGAIREDRLVLPIPPGMRWSDDMPLILPQQDNPKLEVQDRKQIANRKSKIANQKSDFPPLTSHSRRHELANTMPSFAKKAPVAEPIKPAKAPKPKVKMDPKLTAAARELRDRWLEKVNAGEYLAQELGKYDLSRGLPGSRAGSGESHLRLTA
jgi:hypothetical protein